MNWQKEDIPDEDRVFMRVHKMYMQAGSLNLGVFKDHKGSMSVDWERYSKAAESKGRGRTPVDNGVISLVAGDVRAIPQTVSHDPIQNHSDFDDNQSHSEVIGTKTEKVRVQLGRLCNWEIQL